MFKHNRGAMSQKMFTLGQVSHIEKYFRDKICRKREPE